jgi:hypothetical protein
MKYLYPKYLFCGHMHTLLRTHTGTTRIHCLAKVPAPDAVVICEMVKDNKGIYQIKDIDVQTSRPCR